MLHTSTTAPSAAFFRDGIWYRFCGENGDCYTAAQIARFIRDEEKCALRSGRLAGRALRRLRGKTPRQTLSAMAEVSVAMIADIEAGRGLEVLWCFECLQFVFPEESLYPIDWLSESWSTAPGWRRKFAKELRLARGTRDVAEIVALSHLSAERIESLEAGDGLDALQAARDMLEALALYLDARTPDGKTSLAEYVWSEATR